jgi:hypothetical protein
MVRVFWLSALCLSLKKITAAFFSATEALSILFFDD